MPRLIPCALFHMLLLVDTNAGLESTDNRTSIPFGYTNFNENNTVLNHNNSIYPKTFANDIVESTFERVKTLPTIEATASLNTLDYAANGLSYEEVAIQTIYHVRFGMSLVGITGNIVNIAVCLQSNFRHLPVTPYMVALAVADSTGLYSSVFVLVWKRYTGQPVPDLTQRCNVRWYINLVSLCTSAMLLCAISIQRLIAIRYPLHAKLWLKKRVTYGSLVAIILYAVGSFSPVIVAGNAECQTAGWGYVYLYKVLPYQFLITNNILPDVILVVSNALIASSLKTALFPRNKDSAAHGTQYGSLQKCTILAMTLAVAHLLLTTPLTLYSIGEAMGKWSPHSGPSQELLHASVYLLYTSNHAINFFLCVATSSSFRRSLINLFSCRKCHLCKPLDTANSSETISTVTLKTGASR